MAMKKLMEWLTKSVGVRRGQTTSEYVIIVGLVAIGSIAVIVLFGNQIRGLFGASTKKLAGDAVNLQDYSQSSKVDSAVDRNLSNFTNDSTTAP
jgi:Flp pilus assembly pilin Flp